MKGERRKEKGRQNEAKSWFLPSSIRLFPFAYLLQPSSFCAKPNLCKPVRNRSVKKAKGKSQQRAANARVGGMTAASRCRRRSGAPSAISSSAIECCPSRRHSAFGRRDRGTATFFPFSFLHSRDPVHAERSKFIERHTARAAWRSCLFLLRGRNFALGLFPFAFHLFPFLFRFALR